MISMRVNAPLGYARKKAGFLRELTRLFGRNSIVSFDWGNRGQ
jgi:hypothetical protein